MTNDESLDELTQRVGAWYGQVLGATETALADVGLPRSAAPSLIAALAREGYCIDADKDFGHGGG